MHIRSVVTTAQTSSVNENIPKTGACGQAKKWPLLLILLSIPILPSGCAGDDHERAYTGRLTPESGTCDPPATAILTIRHRALAFSPDTGTLVLRGTEAPTGRLTAALTLSGIDHKPYRLALDATYQAADINGTYTTPRCRYKVSLKKTED